jgi:hypothetical protein
MLTSADEFLFFSDHAWVPPKGILEPLPNLNLPAQDSNPHPARQSFEL